MAREAFARDRADSAALSSRHIISNVKVVVDGDHAHAESEFIRTTLSADGDRIVRRRLSGVELTDLHRDAKGWKIGDRTELIKSDASRRVALADSVRAAVVTASTALQQLELPVAAVLGPVSDARVEIRELLIRYSSVFDQERWALVDSVFTPDAEFGGGAGAGNFVDGAKAPYHDRLTGLHSIAEPVLRIDGDRAWAYTDFTTIAIHEPADGDGERLDRLRSGGFYVDELVRADSGWRISRRAVAFSSSVRDPIDGGADLRSHIERTRSLLSNAPAGSLAG